MKVTSVLFLFLSVFSKNSYADELLPELKIEKIGEGIFLHTSFEEYEGWGLVASNGLIVVDGKNAYIIDTPTSTKDTQELVAWVKNHGFVVMGSVSTHFHDDSTGGISLLNSLSIPTYASKLTNKLIKKDGREQARNSISSNSYWLVKDRIEVFYPGGGHTPDNVVVWLPEKQVLFGGCFVKSKSLGNLNDAVLADWPASVEKLLSRYSSAKLVVPGHGKVGGVSLLDNTKKLALAAIDAKSQDETKTKSKTSTD